MLETGEDSRTQRGTLFFEIARLTEAKDLRICCLKSVPGLLNHDGGPDVALSSIRWADWGILLEWQVSLTAKILGSPITKKGDLIGYLDRETPGKNISFHRNSRDASYPNPPRSQGTSVLPEGDKLYPCGADRRLRRENRAV